MNVGSQAMDRVEQTNSGQARAAWMLLIILMSAGFTSAFSQQEPAATVDSSDSSEQDGIVVEQELLDRIASTEGKRIVMHLEKSNSRLAEQLSSLMSSLGIDAVESRFVRQVPDEVQVRVFYPADEQAGNMVADVLSLIFDEIALVEFQNYQPPPEVGLIEVWLP